MAAPTAPVTADLVEGTGTRSFGAVTTSAGDWLVVEVEVQDDNTGTWPVSEATLGTFATLLDTGTGTGVRGRVLHTAVKDTVGASRTVTVTPSVSTRSYRARLTVVRGSRGPGNVVGSKTAQTVSFPRSGYSSMLIMSVMDWSTGAVGTPAWTPGGTTVASQQGTGATYVFSRWDNSGPTNTATTGDIGTAYTTPAVAVLEMLGTGDGPGGGDDGPQVVPMLLPVLAYDPLMQAVVYPMRPWQRRFQWATQPWLNADTGGGPQAFTSTVAATVGFTSSDTLATGHNEAGQLSFTGGMTRRTGRPLGATVSFVGSVASQTVHHFTQALSATLSFTGAQVRRVVSTQGGQLSFAGTQARATTHGQVASVGLTGLVTRLTRMTDLATLGLGGTLAKRVSRTLSATTSFAGGLTTAAVHFFTQVLTATVGFTGTQLRGVGTRLAGTVGFMGAQVRRVSTTDAASLSFAGTQVRRTGTRQIATLSFVGALTRRTTTTRTAALAFTGGLTTQAAHFFTKVLTGTVGFTGSLAPTRAFTRVLTATLAFTGAQARRAGHTTTAGLSVATTLGRRVATRLTATLGPTGLLGLAPSVAAYVTRLRIRVRRRLGSTHGAGQRSTHAHGREPPRGTEGREGGS